MCFCATHSIIRGLEVMAYGKIKCLAATLSLCSFYCFRNRTSCISSPAQLSQEMVKFYSHLLKGAGQRSASSPRSPEKNRWESQWHVSTVCLRPLLSTEPDWRSGPLSPGTVAGHTPVVDSHPRGLAFTEQEALSWETRGNVLSPNRPPKHVSL